MKKQPLIGSLFFLLLTGVVSAQNVGIGVGIPGAKLHVEQVASTDAVLIRQTSNAGNSIEVIANDATNNNIMLWLRNSTIGASLFAQNTTATSTASNILSANAGLGTGLDMAQTNTGNSNAAIALSHAGTGTFSRGLDINMLTGSTGIGATIFQGGTGRALYLDVQNTASTATVLEIFQQGLGGGQYIELQNASNTSMGSVIFQLGTGRGSAVQISNTTSTAIANGIYHQGLGIVQELQVLNASSGATGQLLTHAGLGRGLEISLSNALNPQVGAAIFHDGNGVGQYVEVSNAAANVNSSGLLVRYNGSGTMGSGGGNAVEIQHNGSNGNAVEIFMGDPLTAAGPTNTTSEYAGLSIDHRATGTSPTAGAIKAAVSATNHSADPTILVNNLGSNDGEGMNVFTRPFSAAGAANAAIYAQAQNLVGVANGFGVGVWGQGNNYGVIGAVGTGGTGIGVYAIGDMSATGTKPFTIDYPLSPADKKLRHFSIESDEVLNLYRGMIVLDANGEATVELPEYFDAVNNTNISYQLTAVGTPVQPYVKTEVNNGQFVVAGAPNTKVSWTLYAERNDPVLQHYEQLYGADYRSPVVAKKPHEQGKYLVPEAYGKDRTQGIFYNAEREKLAQEAQDGSLTPQAAEAPQRTPAKSSQGLTRKETKMLQPTPRVLPKEVQDSKQ